MGRGFVGFARGATKSKRRRQMVTRREFADRGVSTPAQALVVVAVGFDFLAWDAISTKTGDAARAPTRRRAPQRGN
jgi:hypothetical protein